MDPAEQPTPRRRDDSSGKGDRPTAPPAAGIVRLKVVLFAMAAFTMLALVAGGAWLWLDYQHDLDTPLELGVKSLTYEVRPGMSIARVARDLRRRGILRRSWTFAWWARLEPRRAAIKIGEYRIDSGLTPRELLALLQRGKVVQHSLTLIEGWTFAQMMEAVDADLYLEHRLRGLSPAAVMARLGHPDIQPEGRFLVDTYYFPKGMSDIRFLRRAYDAMSRRLKAEWAARAPDLPLATPDEALILASIIEKETSVAGERRRVAGVFIRRLRRGMRLETDPTVIYGLGTAYRGRLRHADLRRDTPYNTYTRIGLPPTPICLPGAAALNAALHPADGDALYFVATGEGGHYFSATYGEHRKAVARYRRSRRKSTN